MDDTHAEILNARDALEWMHAARRGDFATAWALSDAIRARTVRFGDPARPRHVQQIWDGTPIDGRRVLVRCYHGLGDVIQFARYLPKLRRIAKEVVVWVQPKLIELLSTLPARLTWLPLHDGTPDVACDVDVEIMELAHVFRTTLDTIPSATPYLTVPVAASASIAASLAASLDAPRPRIGITWRAGAWNEARSIPFEDLRPLFDDVPGVTWYALQFDARADESHPLVRAMPNTPIAETAALMEWMDLIITIDSLPAHLAGALGRPVWTLLPYDADWRWLRDRDDSPWYPSMRLFRQPSPGDWRDVVAHVASRLARPADHLLQPGRASVADVPISDRRINISRRRPSSSRRPHEDAEGRAAVDRAAIRAASAPSASPAADKSASAVNSKAWTS